MSSYRAEGRGGVAAVAPCRACHVPGHGSVSVLQPMPVTRARVQGRGGAGAPTPPEVPLGSLCGSLSVFHVSGSASGSSVSESVKRP